MQNSDVPACDSVIAIEDEPHHHLVVENDCVRAYTVEVGPKQCTLCHAHGLPYLMFVAGDAEVMSTSKDGEARRHHYADAFCEFSSAGLQHVVENLGETPFRNLIFEVLPAAKQVHRPGMPFASVAGVRASQLYAGEEISAELIELASGAQTEISGPAIVASAYEYPVEVISPEGGARKLRFFHELEYVHAGSSGLLRCESGQPARVVVVSLGHE